MRLTADEFDRERRYQTVMYFIRQMLDQGLITEEEYRQIKYVSEEDVMDDGMGGNFMGGNFF